MAHLKKGADGHLLKNAAGHLVKDCGGTPPDDCEYCDVNHTPTTVRVTITEAVTACTGDHAPPGDPSCLTGVMRTLTQDDIGPCFFWDVYTCNGVDWYYMFHFTSATTYCVAVAGFIDPEPGIHALVFLHEGTYTSGQCDGIDEEVPNDQESGACGGAGATGPCGGGRGITGHGGTAAVDTTS